MIWVLFAHHPHYWLKKSKKEKGKRWGEGEGDEKNRRADCYQSEGMRRRN